MLIFGGLLGFLPLLGFWMVPLGILLLADDVPFLRRPAMAALGAVQGWWDRYRAKRTAGDDPRDIDAAGRDQPEANDGQSKRD